MDHFLSGLDNHTTRWYASRGPLNGETHEFAVGPRILTSNSGTELDNSSGNPEHDVPDSIHSSSANLHLNHSDDRLEVKPGDIFPDERGPSQVDIGPDIEEPPSPPVSAEVLAAAARASVTARALGAAKMFSENGSVITPAMMQVIQATQVKEENESDRPPSPSEEGIPMGNLLPSQKPKPKSQRWDTKKICNICGKVLSRGDKLKNHMRIHTNNYPYHCEICGHGFLRPEGLRVHTRIHTGERPYVCPICGKSYTRKDKLTRHAIIHTGERPFVCQHCGKSFTRKDKMQRHELIHKVEKPFTCVPCNLEFSRQDGFNAHMERKHPERLTYTLVQEPRFGSTNLSDYLQPVLKSIVSTAASGSSSPSILSQAQASTSSSNKTLAALSSRLPGVATSLLPLSQ